MDKDNIDFDTVNSFGSEWSDFTQDKLSTTEHRELFDNYFHIFPWEKLPENASGFDMGCGSGRWAKLVAPQVGHLNCLDPSEQALSVAKRNLRGLSNVTFMNSGVSDHSLAKASQDFGYSLGVLHHIPDTKLAMSECVSLLKDGAPFFIYLYFNFDNKPLWYKLLWSFSNIIRRTVCRLPNHVKTPITNTLAYVIYLPLAKASLMAEKLGFRVEDWPLSSYRHCSLYTMKTDSRDRFGTPLEQRFSKEEIREMMIECGLGNIVFSNRQPYWCAIGFKEP